MKLLLPLFLLFSQIIFAQNVPVNPDLLNNYWPARWLAHPTAPATQYGVFHFRKTFELPENPARFVVHVSGDHRYQLFVNGKSVSRGPARSDIWHWNFESLDLAPFLQKGKNVLAAVVWNGGENAPFAQMSFQTGFILQGDGKSEALVNTDTSWRVIQNLAYAPEPLDMAKMRTYIVVGDGERVDGSKYPWGWEQPNFDDGEWLKAKTLWFSAKPRGLGSDGNWMLVPREIPPMEERPERLAKVRRVQGVTATDAFLQGKQPLVIPANTTATILLDQGHLTNAYPQLVVSQGNNAFMRLTYAEALIDEKREKGNRNDIEGKTILGKQDVFIADGGTNRLFATLEFRTWRYIQLDVWTQGEPLRIEDFSGIFTGYPFQQKASFRSIPKKPNTIWEVGWRTARLCAQETYVDCPYYEQLQYTGDTRIQALISLYVSGDDRLMRKAIRDYDNSRISDGLTQSRYPCRDMQIIPTFSLFWVSMVHDYWMHRRDDEFVKSLLGGIDDVIRWHDARLEVETMMNGPLDWWNFVDWAWPWSNTERIGGVPDGGRNGGSAILSLQYAYTLRQAAELFDHYGRSDRAAFCWDRAECIQAKVKGLCWDEKRQLLADTPEKQAFSQHANIWAVLTDAVPKEEQSALLRRIMADTSIRQATYYFKFYLFQALKKTGMGDEFLRQLGPWYEMIDNGLTTFAENPEPVRSDCHAWSASPVYEFLSTVCGINPGSPGFATVRIEPFLGDLEFAEGKMPHPRGEIKVALQKTSASGLSAEIELPEGLSGTFYWKGKEVVLKGGMQKIEL
ncbi:MAG: hypothetical protein OHK0019_16910 [Saprospiraceae bacterium]